MNISKNLKTLLWASLLAPISAMPFAQSNFFLPYDPALKFPAVQQDEDNCGLSFGVCNIEYGGKRTGRNGQRNHRSILALADDTQSTLAMLENPVGPNAATITAFAAVFAGIGDDGTRGHLQLEGKFDRIDATFFAGYQIPATIFGGTLGIEVYAPLVHKEVHGIQIADLTANPGVVADATVRNQLTSVLATRLAQLGGPVLNNWSKTGIGDVIALLSWGYAKECVGGYGKIGVSFPSAPKKDINRAFSMALGSDGAWGLPIEMGIWKDACKHLRLGVDADFMIYFDRTAIRRLKTDVDQTGFLLLNKGLARKRHGLQWQLHTFAQAHHFLGGLSAQFGYQYVCRQTDHLIAKDANFDNGIINSDASLKVSDAHNLIARLNYDFFQGRCLSSVIPQIGLYYKFNIGGKNIINNATVGGQFILKF